MTQLHLALHGATSYLLNPWAFGVNVARASLLLRPDVQRHLLLGRDELGFRHVRFGGVFDDAMGVVRPDGSFDFARVEQALDWLMENGLSPFLSLAGGPAAFARATGGPAADPAVGEPAAGPAATADHSATPAGAAAAEVTASAADPAAGSPITGDHSATPTGDAGEPSPLPFDVGRWVGLVRALAAFVDGRYGCDAQEWHFEVWPGADRGTTARGGPAGTDAGRSDRWPGDPAAYLRLYDLAAAAIKSVNRQFKVGGPGARDPDWAAAFVEHVSKPAAEPGGAETIEPAGAADAGDPAGAEGSAARAGDASGDDAAGGGGGVAGSDASGGGAVTGSGLPAVRCDFVTVVGSAVDAAALAADVAAVRQAVTTALGESAPVLLASWDVAAGFDPANDRFAAGAAAAAAMAAAADHVAGALYVAMSDVDGSGVADDAVAGGVAASATTAGPPAVAHPIVRFEPFHGGAGLVTVNDVRKASFNALRFLNEHLGYKVDWRWVDPTPGLAVLVTRDYHHVVRILAGYHAPPGAKPARFAIEGLPESVKWGQVQVVRAGVGSPLEAWAERGKPAFVNKWLLEDLEAAAHPATAEVNFEEFPPRLEPGMVLQLAIPMPDDVAAMD